MSIAANDITLSPAEDFTADAMIGVAGAIVPGSGDKEIEYRIEVSGSGQMAHGYGVPVAGWSFNQSGTTADDDLGTSTYPLEAEGSYPSDNVQVDTNAVWGAGRRFSGSTAEVMATAATPGGFGLDNYITFSSLIMLDAERSETGTLVSVSGDPSNMSDDTDNEQLRVQIDTAGRVIVYWERDNGGDPRHAITHTSSKCLPSARALMLTVIRRVVDATYLYCDVLVNGSLWERFDVTTEGLASGGTSANMKIGIGRLPNETVAPFKGLINSTVIMQGAPNEEDNNLALAEVARVNLLTMPVNVLLNVNFTGSNYTPEIDSFEATATPFLLMANDYASNYAQSSDTRPTPIIAAPQVGDGGDPAEPVNPTVENVTQGPPIRTNQFWECDLVLAPEDGVINRIIVWVGYGDLNAVETAYDGASFTPDYNGLSTLEPLGGGNGFHVKLLRNGGWIGSPRVFVHANSDLGGVNQ